MNNTKKKGKETVINQLLKSSQKEGFITCQSYPKKLTSLPRH